MLMQWLKQKIDDRVLEVSDNNWQDVEVEKIAVQFQELIEAVQEIVPEEKRTMILNFEDLMMRISYLKENLSYRQGLMEGMSLQRDIAGMANAEDSSGKELFQIA